MSRIQKASKPHIVNLILGHNHILRQEAQLQIATWATMATTTGEYFFKRQSSVAISYDERMEFMRTKAPMDGWRIWLGNYSRRNWEGHFYHARMAIHGRDDMIIPNVQNKSEPLPNTQWTTVMIGKMYLHIASSSSSPDWIDDWDWENEPRARALLVQIWPIQESFIAWPVQAMTDIDAVSFSTAQFRSIHRRETGRTFLP